MVDLAGVLRCISVADVERQIAVNNVEDIKNIELDARAEIARKVGRILSASNNPADQKAAIELARVLAEDVAVTVREALSKELRTCMFLPQDLISIVAKDIEQVSMPFLVASEAVDDDFLEEIVRSCGDSHQEAIAMRKDLSEALSFAISDVGCYDAVDKLTANVGADMSMRSYKRVLERFPEEISLMEKLATRADLPVEIIESLVFKVSQAFGQILIEKFGISRDYTSYLVSLANRQVFSRTLEISPLPEIKNYLTQLNAKHGLGSDILLTYLQNNNLRLFTMSLSVLLDKPYEHVEDLVSSGDKKVMARLLDSTGFSKSVIGVLLISYERLA